MAKNFDYEAAKNAGYSDEEIGSFLQESYPLFDASAAKNAGYSQNEINSFLASKPQKQQGIRGELERKVAAPVTEFALRAATAIPDTYKGVSSLLAKGGNELVKALGAKGLSDEEMSLAGKTAHALGPFTAFPETSQLESLLKQVTGGRLEPTTPGERALKNTAGTAGSIAGFGPGAALGTPARALGTAIVSGTTAGLEEVGVNPYLALTGGIATDLLSRSGASLIKRLAKGAKAGIPKTTGELAGRVARLTPEQVKQEVIDAGKRLGISQGEIPLSAQVSSPAIHGVETKLRESSLSGRHLEKQLSNVEKKTKTAFQDIADMISSRTNLLPGAVSEEAIAQLKKIEEKATETYSNLYKESSKLLPQNAVSETGIGKVILKQVDDLITNLGRGTGTPAKDAIRNRMIRLSNDWKARFGNGAIPIQDLIDLKRDLNQIIKYEVKGGVDKALNPLLNMSKNAIQRYGKTNQPFSFRFNEAERQFADSAKKFRKNDAVKALLETQNPQQIIQKMKNVKTYRELRDLFNRTPEGKQAFQDLSRYLLEDIIGSKLLNKEGNVSWGNASGMLKNAKNREIVREIIGKDNFDKLKDIRKFSSGIEEGLRKFANSSGTATKGLDIALILGTLGKGLGQIFSGQVIKGGKTMSYILVPRVMANLMSNPEFIQAMVDTAHAGRGSNPKLFFDAAQTAARFAIPAIIEANSGPNDEENK